MFGLVNSVAQLLGRHLPNALNCNRRSSAKTTRMRTIRPNRQRAGKHLNKRHPFRLKALFQNNDRSYCFRLSIQRSIRTNTFAGAADMHIAGRRKRKTPNFLLLLTSCSLCLCGEIPPPRPLLSPPLLCALPSPERCEQKQPRRYAYATVGYVKRRPRVFPYIKMQEIGYRAPKNPVGQIA
jgi:hypothetical protein